MPDRQIVLGVDLFRQLQPILGLPDNTTRCVITMELDSVAIVELQTFAESSGEVINKTYRLIEVQDDATDQGPDPAG
jgi:hypothetical protein